MKNQNVMRRYCAQIDSFRAIGCFLCALIMVSHGTAQSLNGRYIRNNTPLSLSQAEDLGPEDSYKTMSVTLWLLSPNESSAMDARVESLYDKRSRNYHHWITQEEFDASLAPTREQAEIVRGFLKSTISRFQPSVKAISTFELKEPCGIFKTPST
jgi:subtilase family serine protease